MVKHQHICQGIKGADLGKAICMSADDGYVARLGVGVALWDVLLHGQMKHFFL